MGLGLRIFIINDDDTVRRFPFSRYERLLQGDSKEHLPQYAGKKKRFIARYLWEPTPEIRPQLRQRYSRNGRF
jgi:hypothetical protein